MTSTKVLVVDDEIEFASTLSERLQLRNYKARAVYCAEDAIAVVRIDPPDVVLLDLKMPGMSGAEILRTIKQFDSSIQFIVLTGVSENLILSEGIEDEVYDYIMKPVDIGNLTKKIDDATKQKTKKDIN
jgi:DNA-binding NtrC family response regulator